jgi:hypothetical protein
VIPDSLSPREFALHTAFNLCTELVHLTPEDVRGTVAEMIKRILPSVADALRGSDPAIADALCECMVTLERFQVWRGLLLQLEHEGSVLLALGLLADALERSVKPDSDLSPASPAVQSSRSR